jgi:hypothetical protein
MKASKELSKHELDFVGMREVRWEGGGTESEGEYTLFYGKGNENHKIGTGLFLHKSNISTV